MKRRAAIITVDFDLIAKLLCGDEANLHLARPSFQDNGTQIFELFITHPDLEEMVVGAMAPRKRLQLTKDAEGRVVKREFV